MKQSGGIKFVAAGAVVLFVAAALIWARMQKSSFTAPDVKAGDIYYRGPMKSKSGNWYANEDGSKAEPPPGETAAKPEPAKKAVSGSGND